MFACVIRAKRLKYIISPLDNNITTHHLFGATMIGYFGNGILFFRLGELLKAYAISQGRQIKPSESFGFTTVLIGKSYFFANSKSLWSCAGQPNTAPNP